MLDNFEVIKLWIDDVRTPPDNTWHWVKNSKDAINLLSDVSIAIQEVSFDHDLGGDDTVMAFLDTVETLAYEKVMPRFNWHVHSANPVGRANIIRTMHSIERYWNQL